jgi:cytoskeleton protein RodZ
VTTTQEQAPGDDTGIDSVAASAGPGARLRAAREAAGLSLDQVAQQLKLAPRQVKALEDESFGDLPGRTFSRGFVRNYARLLHLDAQDLLAHLPDVAQAPALESPTLHSTGTMIAELPSSSTPRAGLGRWLIPLILIGCIVGAAAYEWYRGGLSNSPDAPPRPVASERLPVAMAPMAASTMPPAVALPNPLTPVPQSTPTIATTATATATSTAPSAVAPPVTSAAASTADTVTTTVSNATPANVSQGDAPLLLTYRGPSWTEIRDRTGQVVVSRLVAPGSVEPVKGVPPFEVVLGNAHVVTLAYRGKPVDLLPYTHQNVARLTLQ